ncbi:innexin inx4-like [Drosophila subpulchrella]|uniref:innexin inx4-like n=1 Tax=Drosophila subpulchrella TaxID=1486046 RepID=UPI0018A15451|nr:innexin inx4-like [Drosophila subpulchrella]
MYAAVKPLSKYLQFKSVHIYDAIFTLHSKVTVALLLACTFLLSSKQYFGDPIQCLGNKDKDFVHAFCWIYGAYVHGNTSLEPLKNGAAQCRPDTMGTVPMEKRRYIIYYQWVVLVLLLESFVFYLPAFLWKIWEGGRLKHLCDDFHKIAVCKDKSRTHLRVLVKYFSSDYKETHFRYFASYVFCEILNLSVSIINFILLDLFFGGFWARYWHALVALSDGDFNNWNSITMQVFPKCAKCEVYKGGPSGSPTIYDHLCLLPLNILNEKIFAFLWMWFILVAALVSLKFLYRLATALYPGMRLQLLRARARFMPKLHLQVALRNCSFGDWFVLMRAGNNISPEMFRKLLEELYEEQSLTKKIPPGADEI